MTDQQTPYIPPPCEEEAELLHADEHIVVAVKPAGLLSVPGRIVKDCLVNRLIFDYPDIGVVHRLDLDTSGVMVLARTALARSELGRQFRERLVQKVYEAVVFGIVAEDQGEIDLPLAPDPVNRPRQLVDHERGKAALTRYQVLERKEDRTRLRLTPVTGRSHQLRLHLAAVGHPILGCDLYAHPDAFAMAERLMLHASELQFSHPASGESMTFRGALPF